MIRFMHAGMALGGRAILSDITWTFDPDSVTVIRGASGAGKSTLLNLCCNYLQPTTGEVVIDGSTDYLLQEDLLFAELTVRENLRLRMLSDERPAGSHERAISDALERTGLGDRADARAGDLSGGERRRVELAGILLSAPANLLLDEPVANLDPRTREQVYDALWRVTTGTCVVIVTHEQEVPGMPSHAVQVDLEGGRLRAQR